MDAANFNQVFNWLWTSGQLSERDIRTLPQFGIRTVINLSPPDSSSALKGEAELVTALGISYIQIPVKWDQPTVDQFAQFCNVLKTHEGKACWIHCAMNMRVSVFLYLYRRLYMNESEAEAAELMHSIWEPNETWRTFIDNVLAMMARYRQRSGLTES
jgi:protein tyrosine phosphatase (PTP) superfamily phosphohydrolase (DUF442 family)